MNSKETVSLKEYFERILAEKDKAINAALASAKEAVAVAEKNAEKWRDQANEWRGAMSDREKTFITRREMWIASAFFITLIVGVIGLIITN